MTHLPTTRKEMEQRGWEEADVILFSGDAYIDHPSFGVAVISRVLEAEGLRVAIVPQPSWHGDLRDFRRLGRPRLFFGIAPGAMDSMVNKYTAARRLRSEDAYSPDGRHDMRPDMPTIVYTECLRRLYPDVPVVLGGVEASMRRLAHYDYWQGRIRPSLLADCDADCLIWGMGEKPITEIARRLLDAIEDYHPALHYDDCGNACITRDVFREAICGNVPQIVWKSDEMPEGDAISIASYEECLRNHKAHSANFRIIEEESNAMHPRRIVQQTGGGFFICEGQYPPLTTEELDAIYDLPYTRLPHPKYNGHRIPAYEMIRHSITMHRGCFGGCAFCTISAHQGKFVASRSKESILREAEAITRMPDYRGTISDLGGPSANMYRMGGRDRSLCERCRKPSCLHPRVCPNLLVDHRPLTDIYTSVAAMPNVRHCFVGSGVRYDLILHKNNDEALDKASMDYAKQLITHHVSGRLKVAPEHTCDHVLNLMRKPSFRLFHQFKALFDRICRGEGLKQQLIPYFISSHPGCREQDMAQLAEETRGMGYHLEQVQDFTPTPMTVSTETWATGLHPYTGESVYSAKSDDEKQKQRQYFFWWKK